MSQPTTEIRTLDDSQVYRHIFKAEADVLRSLANDRIKTGKDVSILPVVKNEKSGLDTGILNERQKIWTSSQPNQGDVENPVLVKYKRNVKAQKEAKSETYYASKEVRGLKSDVLDTQQAPTGIIERIQASRKERHEAVLEDMFQELALINAELEPQIDEACNTVKEYIEQDLQDQLKELQAIQGDENLIDFSLNDFHKLWSKTEHHTLVRQSWIDQLDVTLEAVETDRAKLIQDIFKSYTQKLTRIAHLMPPDVHKLMESESLEANKTLLSNKRHCADLIRKLKVSDTERERKHFLYWKTRIEDWKGFKKDSAIKSFNSFMSSPGIVNPSSIQRDMKSLNMQQINLNQKRLDLFKFLRDMKPPNSTKTAVYQWQNSLSAITEQLDELHAKYKLILQMNYEKIIQDCEEELNRLKIMLFNEGVLNEEDVDQLSTEQLLPLIGEKRARFEYEIEKFEKYTDELSAAQKQEFRSLFKYLQGAAHVWDTHEIALAKEERELQERLDKNRREHDAQNQIKEAKFDIVMDRMRQDASEEALKMSLKQSLEMLEEIKKSYYDFHTTQLDTTKQYPSLVEDETKHYDDVVCKYFNVGRRKRKPVPKRSESQLPIAESSERTLKVEKVSDADPIAIQLSNGTVYYIYAEEEEEYGPPPDTTMTVRTSYTFLTDDQEDTEVMPYVSNFEIKSDMIQEIKEHVLKEFLEHLEAWKKDAIVQAENVMTAKGEELNNELDLRLHLHEPRPGRVEKDVHNVRAAELVMHKDRVMQHCQGILASLATFKSRFTEMIKEHNVETDKFKSSVEALENTFVNATKSHELLSIKDEVGNQLEEYMIVIRASLRKFRQDLDEMLNKLRNSNARFRRLLKIFSEGGNFCPEEVEEFRKKLEHMASKIDNAEGSMMAELEGMETKRLDSAHEYSGKLEERFKQHLFDLTFLEKTARWLTNIQVRIKSEVADSNTQAQKIAKIIATFDRRIDAVLKPNLDREQITAEELHETLMPILETFHARVAYLDCAVEEGVPSPFDELQASISKTETIPEEKKVTTKRSRKIRQSDSHIKGSKTKLSSSSRRGSLKRPESEIRPITVSNSKDLKAASTTTLASKASLEIEAQRPTKTRSVSSGTSKSFPKIGLNSKFDKKYSAFGDGSETSNHFLGRITTICRDGLDGLLNTADQYYRQKGNRQSTRPHAIHDNFDICAEALIQRLKSYESQAADYHNSCIQELRAQLLTFGKSLVRFPALIINFTLTSKKTELDLKKTASKQEFNKVLETLERQKRNHKTLLRPTLGHPNNRSEMTKLKDSEAQRKMDFENNLKKFVADSKEMQQNDAVQFVECLNQLTNKLLRQFDTHLTTDDVKKGKVPPKPKTEKQLLREKLVGISENSTDEKKKEVEKVSWENLSLKEFLIADNNVEETTKNINCRKVTAAHKAIIGARDKAYQKYQEDFKTMLKELEDESQKLTQDEMRWTDNWNKSIDKIFELY